MGDASFVSNDASQSGTDASLVKPDGAIEMDAGCEGLCIDSTHHRLALGGSHTCIINDEARVRVWGNNSAAQLGYGNTENIGDNETPASAGDVVYE